MAALAYDAPPVPPSRQPTPKPRLKSPRVASLTSAINRPMAVAAVVPAPVTNIIEVPYHCASVPGRTWILQATTNAETFSGAVNLITNPADGMQRYWRETNTIPRRNYRLRLQ